MRTRGIRLAACATLLALALGGCSRGATVTVSAAPNAPDPACASVILNLPETIGDSRAPQERRTTSSQATAAWGNPVSVELRCGVPELPPTTDECTIVNDLGWIQVAEAGTRYTFVTYGRAPAVEVTVDNTHVSAVSALTAITPALQRLDVTGNCE